MSSIVRILGCAPIRSNYVLKNMQVIFHLKKWGCLPFEKNWGRLPFEEEKMSLLFIWKKVEVIFHLRTKLMSSSVWKKIKVVFHLITKLRLTTKGGGELRLSSIWETIRSFSVKKILRSSSSWKNWGRLQLRLS